MTFMAACITSASLPHSITSSLYSVSVCIRDRLSWYFLLSSSILSMTSSRCFRASWAASRTIFIRICKGREKGVKGEDLTRPGADVMVDWALKIRYLSVHMRPDSQTTHATILTYSITLLQKVEWELTQAAMCPSSTPTFNNSYRLGKETTRRYMIAAE